MYDVRSTLDEEASEYGLDDFDEYMSRALDGCKRNPSRAEFDGVEIVYATICGEGPAALCMVEDDEADFLYDVDA